MKKLKGIYSDYIVYDEGDNIIITRRDCNYSGFVGTVTSIDGTYHYIHVLGMPEECILELYSSEIKPEVEL